MAAYVDATKIVPASGDWGRFVRFSMGWWGQDCAGQGRGGNWRLVVWPGVMQAKVVAARRTVPMGIVSAKNKAARGGWLLPSRVS